MLLNKHNLSIASFCCAEKSRFTLDGILVTPSCTVVTDGHRLVKVTTPTQQGGSDAFPALPNFTAVAKWKPFIMPRVDAQEIARAIPKVNTIPVLNHAAVGAATKDSVQVAVTDLERKQVFDVRPCTGNFPDYERVIPTGEPVLEVGLNAKYMAEAFDALAKFGDKRMSACMLRIREKANAVEIFGRNLDTGQEMTHIVMPLRVDGLSWKAPEKLDMTPAAAPAPEINTLELAYNILADLFSGISDAAQQERLLMDPTLAGIVQSRILQALNPPASAALADPEPEPEPAVVQ